MNVLPTYPFSGAIKTSHEFSPSTKINRVPFSTYFPLSKILVTCDTVMSTELPPARYCVETLISQGLFVLAGEPKIGKSKLSLDMCLSVAKGEMVLGQKTAKGAALYLALEDTLIRLQNRLFELTDEPVDNVYFSLLSASIGSGLEQDIESFYLEHSDLRLVIIDTLQKV